MQHVITILGTLLIPQVTRYFYYWNIQLRLRVLL